MLHRYAKETQWYIDIILPQVSGVINKVYYAVQIMYWHDTLGKENPYIHYWVHADNSLSCQTLSINEKQRERLCLTSWRRSNTILAQGSSSSYSDCNLGFFWALQDGMSLTNIVWWVRNLHYINKWFCKWITQRILCLFVMISTLSIFIPFLLPNR